MPCQDVNTSTISSQCGLLQHLYKNALLSDPYCLNGAIQLVPGSSLDHYLEHHFEHYRHSRKSYLHPWSNRQHQHHCQTSCSKALECIRKVRKSRSIGSKRCRQSSSISSGIWISRQLSRTHRHNVPLPCHYRRQDCKPRL